MPVYPNDYKLFVGKNFFSLPWLKIPVYDVASVPEPTIEEMSTFNALAWDTMFPDLESSLNLAVSLIEMKDVTRLLGSVKSWRNKYRKYLRLKSLKKAGVSTRDVAEAHLSYAFGLMPLVSDARGIWDVINNFDKRLEDFQSRQGRPQVRHFRQLGEVQSESESNVPTSSYWMLHSYKRECRVDKFATMRYTYTVPGIYEEQARFRALRDMLGLRFGFSTAWELIPFSFVIDWIFNVGALLKRFERPLIQANVVVKDYCISYKVVGTVTQEVVLTSGTGGSWKSYPIRKKTSSTYVRRRSLPNSGDAFINRGQYGLNQLVLSGSLLRVLQRR
jgi:hypothetical protein